MPEERGHNRAPMRIRQHKHVGITIAIIAVLFIAVLAVMLFQTYDSVQVLDSHSLPDSAGNGYESFAGDILKYNTDGVSLMDANGEEEWNQPVQMQRPAAAVNGDYAVVADVTGTSAFIFDKKGMTGEADCAKPIEKADVSAQGTVTVIQENGATPVVACFDKEGKLLLENQTALTETGYPLSATVSDDGAVLAVSYMKVSGKGVGGQVIYYDLKTKDRDKVLFKKTFENEAAGEVFFMDDFSVVIAEKQCLVYKGLKEPKEKKKITLHGRIEKIFRDERYFGLLISGESGDHRLRVYGRNGSGKLDKPVKGSYEKMEFCDKQVMLYSGQACCIYTLRGIRRFEGQLEDSALFMTPIRGMNRYAVVTNDGIDTVRLTK